MYLDTLLMSASDKTTLVNYLTRILKESQDTHHDTPILVIHGSSCSGKTVLTRVMRQLFTDRDISFIEYGADEYEQMKNTDARVAFIQAGGEIKDINKHTFVIMVCDMQPVENFNVRCKQQVDQIKLGKLDSGSVQIGFAPDEIKLMAEELAEEMFGEINTNHSIGEIDIGTQRKLIFCDFKGKKFTKNG